MALFAGLLFAASVAAGAYLLTSSEPESDMGTAVEEAVQQDGTSTQFGVVNLSQEAQERSGIDVQKLDATQQRQSLPASGSVIDLQPLIDLQSRALAARADVDAAKAALQTSTAEYERVRRLHGDDGNMSLRAVQAAQASRAADQAKVDQAAAVLKAVQATATYQFGPVLARWALNAEVSGLQPFLNGEAGIVRIAMPLGSKADAPPRIQVSAEGLERSGASLIGPSRQADPLLPGRTFLYRSSAPLPAGARVTVWLPAGGDFDKGLLVPESAVVWYGGQPWAFVQTGKDTFERRAIPPDHVLSDAGYIVAGGFTRGDAVVVTGAQLLLSEEFRASIQSEDGDD